MSQPDIMQAVNRCTQTFHRVKAEQPNNHEAAGTAFLAELPILTDPVAFQAYFACLGQALTLGVIDLVDLGRYCHLARMAMSAWKLANPTPTKGNHFAPEEAFSRIPQSVENSQNALPHPPKGNHSEDEANRIIASHLPDIETQHAIYKSLRQRGIQIPSNSHLRKNPMKALFYCNLPMEHINNLPPASSQPAQAAA